jgi:hypothetical protein
VEFSNRPGVCRVVLPLLLLFCWRLIAATAGSYAADNSGGELLLLGAIVNAAAFMGLSGIVDLALRRFSVNVRRNAVVVVLVLYLVLRLGVSFATVAQMEATGKWL